MPNDPTNLLAAARSAFPKFAPLMDALASVIVADTAAPAPTVLSSDLAAVAGQPLFLDGGGTLMQVDLGDPAGRFNSLRGYNVAHVYESAGTCSITITRDGQPDAIQTVHVLPDARPQISLAPGDDLATAIAKLANNTILLLPAGATFDLKATATIARNGVTLRSTGSGPAPRIVRIATPGSYSALAVSGNDVSIEGIEFDSDHPLDPTGAKVGVYAITPSGRNLLVRDCTFRNVDNGLACQPAANGLLMLDCTFTNELRAYGAYLDAMNTVVLLGNNSVGSTNEHVFRSGGAKNVLIAGNDLANPTSKECVSIRTGQYVSIVDNTLRTWVRISEGPQTPPVVCCQDVLVAANHFAGLHPAGDWLQINPGSQNVWIDSNRFDVDEKQDCVGIQAPCSDIKLTENIQALANGAKTAKALVDVTGSPQFTEAGTHPLGA